MTADPKDLIQFLNLVGRLKKIKRSGWVLRGVKEPESVADHIFRVALMTWIFGQGKRLNLNRAIKMALAHDLCEVFAGDATPFDHLIAQGKYDGEREFFNKWPLRLTKKAKNQLSSKKHGKEEESLATVVGLLPTDLREGMRELWREYEEGLTREAVFVRQVDKMENMISACEYQLEDEGLPIRAFWVQLKEVADDPDLIALLEALDQHYNVSLKK